MTCHFNTTGHDGQDILPVRLGLRSEVQLCCAGCRTEIARHGFLRVVDRRVTDLPVLHERRAFRPRWMANLTAKVMDHGGRVA